MVWGGDGSDELDHLADAVENQGQATRDIVHNVHEAAQGTREVSEKIGTIDQASGAITHAVGEVLIATGELSGQVTQQITLLDQKMATLLGKPRAAM